MSGCTVGWYQGFIACHSASHSTSQWLLCGNPVGSSPKRASLCFSASATTPERKSAKVRCGTRMSFSLWQHKGYMPPCIPVFWRAFARLWSYERQCICLQKEWGIWFPDYQRPHTWRQSPGGTRGSRSIGHMASCPFCWRGCEGVRSTEHPHPCKNNAGNHLQSVFSNTFSVSELASSKSHCSPQTLPDQSCVDKPACPWFSACVSSSDISNSDRDDRNHYEKEEIRSPRLQHLSWKDQ